MIEICHLVVDDRTIIITTDHLLITEETRRIEEDHLDHHHRRMPMDGNPAEVLVRIVIASARGEISISMIIEEEKTGAVMIDPDITMKRMKCNNWDAA